MALPQGLAYAAVAGLPIVYGVTCSAVAALIAPFFASSRYTILGPTNATAFMVFSFFAARNDPTGWHWMPLIVLMAGVILVVASAARMADLLRYVSRSVVVGYISAAAVLIIVNQLRPMLGISQASIAGITEGEISKTAPNFFSLLANTFEGLPHFNPISVGIAAATLFLYLVLQKLFRSVPVFAISLLGVSFITWFLMSSGVQVDTYAAQAFGPSDLLPQFPGWKGSSESLFGSLFHRVGLYFSLSLGIAFLASLEKSVMADSLASQTGQKQSPDRNQDMFSVGIANIGTSFLSGMPASGSLTRSSLNLSSGATSKLSSIVAGLLCIVGALTLGGLVKYIPRSALAVLVICIALSLISPKNIRIALRATYSDAIVLIATFCSALLLPLHVAIFVGTAIAIALYLQKASQPHLAEYGFDEEGVLAEQEKARRENAAISIVHVEGELFFGAAELFRSQIQRTLHDEELKVIVLRLKNAHHLDATSVMALEELVKTLRGEGKHLIVSGCDKDVYRVLKNSGVVEVIGRENIFPGSPSNPTLATRNALIRAKELLGTDEAEVRIFYDVNQEKA